MPKPRRKPKGIRERTAALIRAVKKKLVVIRQKPDGRLVIERRTD